MLMHIVLTMEIAAILAIISSAVIGIKNDSLTLKSFLMVSGEGFMMISIGLYLWAFIMIPRVIALF